MGDRYVKSHENKKILYVDANIWQENAVSQSLPYDEIKFHRNVKLEDIWILMTMQILDISLKLICEVIHKLRNYYMIGLIKRNI